MQDNVEIVKTVIDAFNRRDVAAPAEFATPDIEWFPAMPGTVEGGSYRGGEGVETYLAEIGDTWEEYRIFGDEFRDLGDRVVVLGRTEGRGRCSGIQVDSPIGVIYAFATARCRASSPISITASRCGRRA